MLSCLMWLRRRGAPSHCCGSRSCRAGHCLLSYEDLRFFPNAIRGHPVMRASQPGPRHRTEVGHGGFINVTAFTILAALWLAFGVALHEFGS